MTIISITHRVSEQRTTIRKDSTQRAGTVVVEFSSCLQRWAQIRPWRLRRHPSMALPLEFLPYAENLYRRSSFITGEGDQFSWIPGCFLVACALWHAVRVSCVFLFVSICSVVPCRVLFLLNRCSKRQLYSEVRGRHITAKAESYTANPSLETLQPEDM